MTFKQACRLPYGSPEQIDALDAWYERFAAWCERHQDFDGWYPRVWDAIHLTDEGKMARMRWLYRKGIL